MKKTEFNAVEMRGIGRMAEVTLVDRSENSVKRQNFVVEQVYVKKQGQGWLDVSDNRRNKIRK